MRNPETDIIRYRLHRKLRLNGYRVNSRERTVYVFFEDTELSDDIRRLHKEFGYSIQTELVGE